jgi:hypothetical protein
VFGTERSRTMVRFHFGEYALGIIYSRVGQIVLKKIAFLRRFVSDNQSKTLMNFLLIIQL